LDTSGPPYVKTKLYDIDAKTKQTIVGLTADVLGAMCKYKIVVGKISEFDK